jgi:hypothetical protein
MGIGVDPTWLFISLFPGGIGFVLIFYGRKEHSWLHVLFGVLFTVYPLFTPTVTTLVLVGIALGGVFQWAVKSGY